MPVYSYRGRDAEQAIVSGTIEAETPAAVVQQLVVKGIVVIDVVSARIVEAVATAPKWWEKIGAKPITDDDVILFSRQMHTLQRTAVPVFRALSGLQKSTGNSSFALVLADIRASLDQGRELSAAMARHPAIFSAFYVAMIRVGEFSGRLAEVLKRLIVHLEFEKDVRGQIREALRYPLFVMIAGGMAMVVLNIFVIPVFARVFGGLNAQLPLVTRILIGFSNGMVQWWPLLAILVAGGWFLVRTGLNSPGGRYWWDRIKLKLPIVGEIILKATLARFARSFALASQSGIPVLEALTLVARTADNAYFARQLEDMRSGIESGDSLHHCATESGVFTPVVLQMIAVGEETGEIDSLLTEIADMYERETAYAIKGLSVKIEPILLVLMAGLVLVLALGIFLPMWSLGQATMGRAG
ncbi:MAG: type II secretion system F family protein [Pseudomonadota bacterium]